MDTAAVPAVIPEAPTGQFVKGVSGNPAGRPAGSKNLQKQLEDSVREYIAHPSRVERLKRVLDKVITKAEDGHMGAAKLLFDKIIPNAREEQEQGGGGGRVYVFRIENATHAAKPLLQPIDAEVVVIPQTPQETK